MVPLIVCKQLKYVHRGSIDTLGPRGLKVVGRRLLRGSDVGNPHWPNATLLIGSTSSPHVGSTSGPHVITLSVPRRANFCEIDFFILIL